jgi:transcriptional regulator with XRE-family HTH domain
VRCKEILRTKRKIVCYVYVNIGGRNMFYETVLKLCAQKGISLTNLMSEELHMSTGNITRWKNGTVPGSTTLQKIANYFGVSVDYLLGNEQKNKPAISSGELQEKLKPLYEITKDFTDEERAAK